MILKKIKIMNYRQLQSVELDMQESLTVLAGPNNSGKTTLISVLKGMFCDKKLGFSYSDIPISLSSMWLDKTVPVFQKIMLEYDKEKGVQKIIDEMTDNNKFSNDYTMDNFQAQIQVDYDPDNDNIQYFADYLMDLDDTKHSFYFIYTYEPSITAFEKGLNERYDRMAARVRDIANPGCIEKETKFYFLKEELLRIYCNAVIEKCYFYGVPQMRKRLVFMGVRKDIGNPHFPDPTFGPETKKPYRTCRDAISDLPTRTNNLGKNEDEYVKPAETEYQVLMRDGCSILYNHIATNHKQFVKDTIALVPEGGNYKDLPEGVGNSRSFHMAWTRLDGNAPARTVDTGHRNLFHYELNRVPTVRESARIQSFPDNFVFKGSRTKQERQVGNAVPPLLGQALAEELLKIIERSKTNA